MLQWIEWLNNSWFAVISPILIFAAFWVGGLWVRRVAYDTFRRWWARQAKWKGRWLVVETTHSPFLQWSLLLGFYIAIHVSVLPPDSKTIVTKLIISLFIFSLVWMVMNLSEKMLKLYLPQVRQYIARIKAPQSPTPLLLNVIRVILIALGLLVLLKIWNAPDASGILILAAVVVAAGFALRDTITGMPKKVHMSRSTRNTLMSIGKLFLIFLAIAGFVELTRRGYLIFTQQSNSNSNIIIFLLEIGLLILVISALRSHRFRRIKPSFKVVLLPVLGIALVCAFAGIEPLASYKDGTISFVGRGWEAIISSSRSQAGEDIANIIAKIEPAVVRIETEDGMGSGMIIDKSGYILTSNHIVEDAQSATIILTGGGQYQGTVIGKDETSDLAIIKITASGFDFPVVILGNSDKLESGEEVIAIGYSLGLEGSTTVSKGVISALRYSNSVRYIQTDAAINPGNSGGPLINLNGDVVGIVTFKFVGEAVEGMGFAITINDAKPFITEVREKKQALEEAQREKQALLELEKETFRLINIERGKRGLKPTSWNEELHDIARRHSQAMQERSELFHSPIGLPYGECCYGASYGSRYSPYSTPEAIVEGWMTSPKHRAWLLDGRIREATVGIAWDDGFWASWTFYFVGEGYPKEWPE